MQFKIFSILTKFIDKINCFFYIKKDYFFSLFKRKNKSNADRNFADNFIGGTNGFLQVRHLFLLSFFTSLETFCFRLFIVILNRSTVSFCIVVVIVVVNCHKLCCPFYVVICLTFMLLYNFFGGTVFSMMDVE